MPIPPLLSLNGFGGTPVQVHEILDAVNPVQIGSDVPGPIGAFTLDVATRAQFSGLSKMFKGERYCVTLSGAGDIQVRREDEGGAGAWGVVFTPAAGASLSNAESTGLQIVKFGSTTALLVPAANVTAVFTRGGLGPWLPTPCYLLGGRLPEPHLRGRQPQQQPRHPCLRD